MKANTLFLGFAMLVMGAAVFASSWLYHPLPDQSYGSDTMPRLTGLFGLGIGVALVVQALRAGQRIPALTVQPWLTDWRRVGGMVAAAAGVLAYVLFSDQLGFLGVAVPLVLALMLLRGARPVLAVPVAVVISLAAYFLFAGLLLVPLPGPDLMSLF
ncbi:tripartite tricarboxylate transporter TctB family protein [Acidimangrovimonas sediminis]|uniref:tripartite tricarboxylate transporter TctB family protein n=1 Tax=Acidimangrovimonas sediminis TaxID=2056283 RepID=UPI000C805C96|nr:tripartite tricarboxylate transporter TctB family protein [Acidimangrovimonas sediminis]